MKIALINNSGNVGKTTIAREVLGVNMSNAVVIEVETHNAGNTKYERVFNEYHKISATEIEDLYARLVENEDVVLDIGASNILDFLRQLEQFAGLETLIDLFIVPSTKDAKQLQDTIKTINILMNLNISPDKIVVVANRVNPAEFERDFKILLNTQKELGFRFSKDLIIRETSVLKDLELFGKTLNEIMNDDTDYLKKIVETKGTKEQAKWVKLDLAKRASEKVYQDFKKVFNNIIGS